MVIAAVAVVCGLYAFTRSIYYAERGQTKSVLAEVKGISTVQLRAYIDVVEEVYSSSFTIDGQPDSIITIGSVSHYEDNGSFHVNRLGKWQFRTFGRRHAGAYEASTGKPVESDYKGFHIALGPNGPYKDLIPFEVNSLQDLVDHYGELVDLFETWPREAKPGTVVLDDGTTQYFYVVEDSK